MVNAMAKRYYVCPIIGTGTEDDPYRAATADDGVRHSAEIPTDAVGKPLTARCVVTADETDDAAIMARRTVERAVDRDAARAAVGIVSGDIRQR